jgi:hypothetical protein
LRQSGGEHQDRPDWLGLDAAANSDPDGFDGEAVTPDTDLCALTFLFSDLDDPYQMI